MRRCAILLLAVLTLLLPQTTGTGYHPYWNDAGSGTDAGGSPADALPLPDEGTYQGYLVPTDEDWYRLDGVHPEPVCVDLLAWSGVRADATLQVLDGALVREARAPIARDGWTRLAFASPGAARTLVGMEVPHPSDWQRRGPYEFTLSHLNARGLMGDAGTDQDTAGTLQDARPIGSGCLGGVLMPQLGLGDASDAFRLDPPTSGAMTVSFSYLTLDGTPAPPVGDAPRLDVIDANGAVLATLSQGEAVTVPVQGGSPYYLVASAEGTDKTVYLVAVNLPDGNPCRPHC